MEELNNCKQNFNENISDFFQRIEILNSRALSAAQQYTKNVIDLPEKVKPSMRSHSIDLHTILLQIYPKCYGGKILKI